MQVELISYSQRPKNKVVEHEPWDQEIINLVSFCARVSNPSNQNNSETAEKLIRYLIKHKHWSPLETVSMCLEINTTRDIARQILRHRSFSFQEFSQRYADPTKDLDFVLSQARLQDTKNRQNSILVNDEKLQVQWHQQQQAVITAAKNAYNWAMENNIAKEQARKVLPEGLTGSRMYMNGTLRSWTHFIELRSANGTQLEHMEVARACAQVIAEVFPMITEFVSP